METLRNLIGGKWVESASTERIDAVNPSTGALYSQLPGGSALDVDHAVTAARQAQPAWAMRPLENRIEVLLDAAARLEAHVEELAELEALEMGKPLAVGETFIRLGIAMFKMSVEDARSYSFEGEVKRDSAGVTLVVRKPIGVAAVIVPWNFTVAQILVSVGALLTAGNAIVVKPSEKSTHSAVRVFEILGLPDGVANLVLGDCRAGDPLARHDDINLVRFTGSVATGRAVASAAGNGLRRAILELGGKDPVVIDEDVDPVAVAEQVAYGAFVNSGQICTSMERIYVHRNIAEPFVAALTELAHQQVLGDATSPATVMGPMVDDGQRTVVHSHVLDAVAKGAKVLVGGEIDPRPGFFYPATVLVDATEDMDVMQAETFGPVAAVQVVDSYEEGLRQAALTEYGLAMTVFTHTEEHIELAKQVPTGTLWINQWQGGDFGRHTEPAGSSGFGATGGRLSYDVATRPMAVHLPTADVAT
jgi:acyl-CoA reductase-like NAD-dependent aldehyde dehydrogenase